MTQQQQKVSSHVHLYKIVLSFENETELKQKATVVLRKQANKQNTFVL